MINDPIVNEVRKIRDHIASECNYDLHTYFEMLRNEDAKLAEKKSKDKSFYSERDKSEQSCSADKAADA